LTRNDRGAAGGAGRARTRAPGARSRTARLRLLAGALVLALTLPAAAAHATTGIGAHGPVTEAYGWFPEWYEDGIYAPGTTPNLGMLVHTLEHGRIDLQYKPGTSPETVTRLEKLVDELDSGYHMLLFENGTNMPYAVAATAWGHLLGCPTMNDKVFDALRTFREAHIDKGPEVVP